MLKRIGVALVLACLPIVALAQSVPPSGYSGGMIRVVLPTPAPTGCTAIMANDGFVRRIINTNSSTSPTITLYDENASTGTCAAADQIWSGTVAAGSGTLIDVRFLTGLLYKLSGALSNNLIIGLDGD